MCHMHSCSISTFATFHFLNVYFRTFLHPDGFHENGSFFLPGRAGASPFAGQVSAGRIRLVLFCEILVTGVGFYRIGILLRL